MVLLGHRHVVLDAGLGQRLHQRCVAGLVLPWAAITTCRRGSGRCIRSTARPTARSSSWCPIALIFALGSAARPGDHLLDPVGPAGLHLHADQRDHVPQEVAARHDQARLRASVPPAPGAGAARAVRGHLLRGVPGLRHAADRDGGASTSSCRCGSISGATAS